jgi:hypothetical protein
VVEWGDLLDRNLLAGRLMDCRAVMLSLVETTEAFCSPDNTISTLADYILNIILLGDIEGDFPRAGRSLLARHGESFDSYSSIKES